MSDGRLFLVAGAGVLAGGLLAGLVLGPQVATNSPLLAVVLIAAIAGGGAVLVNKVV